MNVFPAIMVAAVAGSAFFAGLFAAENVQPVVEKTKLTHGCPKGADHVAIMTNSSAVQFNGIRAEADTGTVFVDLTNVENGKEFSVEVPSCVQRGEDMTIHVVEPDTSDSKTQPKS